MIEWVDSQGNKLCGECKTYKNLNEFHKDKRSKFGVCYACKVCAINRSRKTHSRRMLEDPEYRKAKRNSYVKTRWNMTEADYNKAWQDQKVCAICKCILVGGHQTHLDHDHETGEIRKFLCTNCNRALGHFQDNVEIIMKAVTYLQEHRKEGTRP